MPPFGSCNPYKFKPNSLDDEKLAMPISLELQCIVQYIEGSYIIAIYAFVLSRLTLQN